VELQEKILSLLLDPKASDIVEAVIRKAGVNFATGQSVQKILGRPENEAAVGGVLLTKGEAVSCDLVVVAIGVIPRTELVAGTLVKINRGIVVDTRCRPAYLTFTPVAMLPKLSIHPKYESLLPLGP